MELLIFPILYVAPQYLIPKNKFAQENYINPRIPVHGVPLYNPFGMTLNGQFHILKVNVVN